MMADLKSLGNTFVAQFQGLNGRHPGLWPFIPRLFCGISVLAAVLVLGWYSYWDGQWQELSVGEKEEVKLKDLYASKIREAINLDALRKQKEQVGQYVNSLEKQLPSKAEMDSLLSEITHAGQGRGLQFELFKPGQVAVKDYYAELPIDIKVTGNYHDLASFSSDIANMSRIVTLNNMSLTSAKDGPLTLDAVAKTFRYLDLDEVAAQRKAASDKKGGKK